MTKLLKLFRGVFQVALRFPGVFSFTITLPMDKVLKSTTKELRISYMVNLILFFAVNCHWVRRRRHQAVHFVPFIGAEAIHMEHIVDFEGPGEC